MRLTRSIVEAIFGSNPNTLRDILRHDTDFYEELASLTGSARRRAQEILGQAYPVIGEDYVRELARRQRLIRVTQTDIRRVKRLFEEEQTIRRRIRGGVQIYRVGPGPLFGRDEDVTYILRRLGIGHVLQSDHLIEQRFLEHIADGSIGISRRASPQTVRAGSRIVDTMAIAVPTNEIYYYRLAKGFSRVEGGLAFGGLYPHVGPASKTSMLARLIPPDSEGAWSLRDIADAHRWVLWQVGFPREPFDRYILDDLAHAVQDGMEHNPRLLSEVQRATGESIPSDSAIRRLLGENETPDANTFMPNNWPNYQN